VVRREENLVLFCTLDMEIPDTLERSRHRGRQVFVELRFAEIQDQPVAGGVPPKMNAVATLHFFFSIGFQRHLANRLRRFQNSLQKEIKQQLSRLTAFCIPPQESLGFQVDLRVISVGLSGGMALRHDGVRARRKMTRSKANKSTKLSELPDPSRHFFVLYTVPMCGR
jgi:hypothetical protein